MQAELVSGHRKTSNSRGPGQNAVVRYRSGRLEPCPKCGVQRYGSGPHAPHFGTRNRLVDCQGEVIR